MVDELEQGVGVLDVADKGFLVGRLLAQRAAGGADEGAVGGGVGADGVAEGAEREVVRGGGVGVRGGEIVEPVEGVGDGAVVADAGGPVAEFVVAGAEGLQERAEGLGVLFQLQQGRGGRVARVAEEGAVEVGEVGPVPGRGAPVAEEGRQVGAAEGVCGDGRFPGGEGRVCWGGGGGADGAAALFKCSVKGS